MRLSARLELGALFLVLLSGSIRQRTNKNKLQSSKLNEAEIVVASAFPLTAVRSRSQKSLRPHHFIMLKRSCHPINLFR